MFKEELKTRLKTIFGLRNVSFNAPGETFEQDTLFVQVDSCRTRTTHGKVYARVEGRLIIYGQNDKLPYGFFNSRLSQLKDQAVARPLTFFQFDRDNASSPARVVNIVERSVSFVFLYSAQYDPNQPLMDSVEFEMVSYLDVGDGRFIEDGDGNLVEVS